MLLERGVNPKVVQKILGHRDIETTLGTYSHVLPEVFDGVAGIVGEIHEDMLERYKKSATIHCATTDSGDICSKMAFMA